MRKRVYQFALQPTSSFPEGAPQREEFVDGKEGDRCFDFACLDYASEWTKEYECCKTNCSNWDCPQHGPALVAHHRKMNPRGSSHHD